MGSCASDRAAVSWANSKSRQALRAVVGNFHTGDLSERAVPVSGVAHQLRGIPVDLVEVGAIWRNPAIARAAAHGSIDRSEGAIASNLRAIPSVRIPLGPPASF